MVRHFSIQTFTLALGACSLLLLGACAEPDPTPGAMLPVQAAAVDPDPTALRIAQAADRATNSLNKLAQIEQFRTPMPDDATLATPGMMRTTSLTWTGPIDQVSRTLAELGGMQFRIVGKEPPLPLVVTVDAHEKPIGEILRDIGFQAGRRADIVLNTATNTIDLRYAPTDGTQPY